MNRQLRRQTKSQTRKNAPIHFRGQAYTLDDAFAMAIKQQHVGNQQEAAELYRLILAKAPKHFDSLNNLGLIQADLDCVDEAIVLYKQAIQCKPDYAYAYYNYGEALASKGNMQEAEQMFLKALSLEPNLPVVFFSLTRIRKYKTPDHPDVHLIQSLLAQSGQSPVNREHLYFSLGKIYDDCGLYDAAFDYYRQANELCRAGAVYSPQGLTKETDAIIKIFSKKFLARPLLAAPGSQSPVFIIGMPRAGSTLLENILSNHPAIRAAGELPTIIECATSVRDASGKPVPFPHMATVLTPDLAAALAAHYEKRLKRGIDPKARYIIDKHPMNFRFLGLIAMLFPNARIIHCTRHPMATCLSNYFQRFSPDYAYSFDLRSLGHFYGDYMRLMEHWRSVLPLPMIDVSYEDTIMNTEQAARRMLDFLGLEWDERCLSPHTNTRNIHTASVWQVRQPIYRQSLEQWKHYEKHLGELKEALGNI